MRWITKGNREDILVVSVHNDKKTLRIKKRRYGVTALKWIVKPIEFEEEEIITFSDAKKYRRCKWSEREEKN